MTTLTKDRVPCPACRAERGDPCRMRLLGRIRRTPHDARILADARRPTP